MRLWKLSIIIIAVTICGTALCCFLSRTPVSVTTKPRLLPFWASSSSSKSSSSSPSPSSSSSSSSWSVMSSGRRRVRSTGGLRSMLSEVLQMFQSYTEAELKNFIDRLVARKQRHEAGQNGHRPKRAGGRGQRQCRLQEAELTVSQLGLGYLSDETIFFHYCGGSCRQRRRNYDLIMKKWTGKGVSRRDRAPCCRPIEYEEDIVVLDNNNKYQTLHEYSAQRCGCI